MESRAIARYVRVSPRKADRVLRLIRGIKVDRAEEILAFTPRPIARQINKVLSRRWRMPQRRKRSSTSRSCTSRWPYPARVRS